VTRGEIWLVNLDPTVGSEIRKTRPCVVVSPREMHDYLRTVLVAPMTTAGREAPFRDQYQSWWPEGFDPAR
jgi:mRNA interferase MazF